MPSQSQVDSPPRAKRIEQWRLNQITVVASVALIDAAYYLMVPSMPQFVLELGVTSSREVAVWTGIMIGITPLITGLVGPLWGHFADRRGLKINALRSTLALCVMYYLSSLCETVYQLLPLRVLLGLIGGYQTLTVALATQISPMSRTASIISSVQVSQITVAAVGPFLGGLLTGAIGIRHTLLVSSALCLISFVLYTLCYRDAAERRPARPRTPVRPALLFSLPNFALLAAMIFIITIIEKNLTPVVPLFVLAHSKDPWRAARIAGIVLSLAALADTIAVWYCGARVRKGVIHRLLLMRWAAGAVVCLGLAASKSVLPFAVLRVLLALVAGGTLTVIYAVASYVIPPERRATGFALLSSCAALGGGMGPLVLSMLASIGLPAVLLVNALFFGALLYLAAAKLQTRDAEHAYSAGGS